MKPFIKVAVLTSARIEKPFFNYSNQPNIQLGQLLKVPFGSNQLLGIVIGFSDHSDFKTKIPLQIFPQILPSHLISSIIKEADHILDFPARLFKSALPKFIQQFKFPELSETFIQISDQDFIPKTKTQTIIWDHLSKHKSVSKSSLKNLTSPSVLQNLLKKNILTTFQKPPKFPDFTLPKLHKLTPDQAKAITKIQTGKLPTLLHGVTGSGKTEIYLQLASDTLAKSKSVILLVPEISLTPQLTSRFQEHFPDHIAVLHSKLSDGERAKTWTQIQQGLKKIVIGPRSAIFAPTPDLGLIILDEYHDDSFKQDSRPFYDARHFAQILAQESDSILIFGSATPRVQDYFFATQT